MTDLRTFVRACLEDIIGAVADAQDNNAAAGRGAIINPRAFKLGKKLEDSTISGGDWAAQMIEFDVAVTAQEAAGSKATVGVVAGILGAGTQGTLAHESSSVSRIKFAVPVVLPYKDA